MSLSRSIGNSIYYKIILGAVLGCSAIIGGMYVGKAVVLKEEPILELEPLLDRHTEAIPELSGEDWAEFGAGDQFPEESYFTETGDSLPFYDKLRGKNSVVIFISPGCPPCMNLVSSWDKYIAPRLKPSIEVLVAVPTEDAEIPPEYEPILATKNIIYYDRYHWAYQYHLLTVPSLVVLNSEMTVQHIQFGYANKLEWEIQNLIFTQTD